MPFCRPNLGAPLSLTPRSLAILETMIASTKPSLVSKPLVSVVIPFYNEGANVRSLLCEVRCWVEKEGLDAEVICVDDGSRDNTEAELRSIAREWPAVRVISPGINRGQAAALWSGFEAVSGDWVATLDGDGQNPPAELSKLWEARHRADMVMGTRMGRKDTWLRRAMSRIANRVRAVALRDGVPDSGCALKVFRREVLGSFLPMRTLYSFMPACAVAAGWSVLALPVSHRPRTAGTSSYGLRVMALVPLLDMLALCWLLRRAIRQKRTPDSTHTR